MIEARGLVKSFGHHLVLKGFDLDVAEGECLTVVGPNGAGKTTLLRVLAGLSKPTRGSVRIAGLDLADGAQEMRRRVGFLSHQPLLYADLSAEENLRFYGAMYDVANLEERITGLLEWVGLEHRRHDLVRTYSRGMRQRLSVARVMLHDPPLLLLDEPYTGLDLRAAEILDALLLRGGADSRTVVLTTHNLDQGLRLSQRALILVNGQVTYLMDERDWDQERFRREYQRQTAGSGE
jgi:heme exporter protein A